MLCEAQDRVPYADYAVRKTLRKAMHDCCFPMHASELAAIRARLLPQKKHTTTTTRPVNDGGTTSTSTRQLSYAEQDQAIQARIPLPWRMRVRLPHVMLAWRLRLKDPGSAPVPGESITYVMTHNGGGKCFEKVETLEAVEARHLPIDRAYYLKSLRVPMDNIFCPILAQRLQLQKKKQAPVMQEGEDATASASSVVASTAVVAVGQKKKKRGLDADADAVEFQVNVLLWNILRDRPLQQDPAKRRACIDASPLARAFARARGADAP